MARVETLSPALENFLINQREAINQRVANYQFSLTQRQQFDQFLPLHQFPLWEKQLQSQSPIPCLISCFDLFLELLSRSLMPIEDIIWIWSQLLPLPLTWGEINLAEIGKKMCNAYIQLQRHHIVPKTWLQNLAHWAPEVSHSSQWLKTGEVLAWKAGMASLRERSLRVCSDFPPALQDALLGLSSAAAYISELQANPWWQTEKSGWKLFHTTRGFRGWGGTFIYPPRLFLSQNEIVVASGDHQYWRLYADPYGYDFKRIPPPDNLTKKTSEIHLKPEGIIQSASGYWSLPAIAGWHEYIANQHTLVVSIPHSFRLHILGLTDSIISHQNSLK